jgi:hypothetical protein
MNRLLRKAHRVKYGIPDPDFPDIPLGGWAGTIAEVDQRGRETAVAYSDCCWESLAFLAPSRKSMSKKTTSARLTKSK